ncbi:hypothetical protein L1049_014348 [Liquidambar formosana]|uniref:Cation/H+ exchanger transmembrane domain-containing protein n=1 Tax=Liquidambar formosana TaxID=63359 RepID=A0AAP0RS60_LIQFO
MVRDIPSSTFPTPDGWQPHLDGFQAMSKVSEFEQFPTDGRVTCKRIHGNHPGGIFYGENPLQFSFTLMLLEIATVILITRAVRFLLKPLKQPRIVSEIIGGIIIGPSVLGRSDKFTTYMFPDNAFFMVKTIGVMGFMFFLFVSGVKMDLGIINKAGKKHWSIAFFGVFFPMGAATAFSIILHKSLDKELGKVSSIGGVASALAITAFPVLYPILKELNLLSSEVGRQALTTAIISDVIGLNAVIAFEAAKQGEVNSKDGLWYMISLLVIGHSGCHGHSASNGLDR